MKIVWFLPFVLAAAGAPALAQHGRGMGGSRGPGASPGVSNPAPPARGSSSAPAGSSRGASAGDKTAAARVADNPRLASRIQPLVPAGMTAQSAASGFKNQGQFLAALHVSHNLNIPFDQVKSKMTGSNPESLGESIRQLRPDLDKASVKKQVKTAKQQADEDLRP